MKLSFNLFGADITLVDTNVPTLDETMQERYDQLDADFSSGSLSEEEISEKVDLFYTLNPDCPRIE